MQRSGSGWFETFLNSHPNISSHGEVFARHQRQANASDVLARLKSVYNLDWYSSAAKNSCTSAVGFKWMLNQVRGGAMQEEDVGRGRCPWVWAPLWGVLLPVITVTTTLFVPVMRIIGG